MLKVEKVQYKQAFPTPIIWLRVNPSKDLNVRLARDCALARQSDEGLVRSNKYGWHGKADLFLRQEESFKALCQIIINSVREVTREFAPRFNLEQHQIQLDGWININPTGGLNRPHLHPGFVWSGCYYVQVPKSRDGRVGEIEFLDPRAREDMFNFKDFELLSTSTSSTPQAGMLVLFPSYLMHWVYPNPAEEDRISIAFNARFLPLKKP